MTTQTNFYAELARLEAERDREKARADAAAHAGVRALEEGESLSHRLSRAAKLIAAERRIAQLEEALRGLRTMVVNVLTDSQLDHVNCGQTIRNALGPVDALLAPDDRSQP
jgi:regulator of protease activity HflC (stomatin/prohibitin superfamily)